MKKQERQENRLGSPRSAIHFSNKMNDVLLRKLKAVQYLRFSVSLVLLLYPGQLGLHVPAQYLKKKRKQNRAKFGLE